MLLMILVLWPWRCPEMGGSATPLKMKHSQDLLNAQSVVRSSSSFIVPSIVYGRVTGSMKMTAT